MWTKGSDILKVGDKYDLVADGKKQILVINNSTFDDEGEYSAEVDAKKTTAKLIVTGTRLKFLTPLKDQTVKEGNTAHFEIELSHENLPVTWYRNETVLHPSRTVLISTDEKKHVLEIREVTLDDTCEIKAEVTELSTKGCLIVIGKSQIQ
uniref:Immunoglobulin I-set domain-containing protein n=1 Tax=Callorhinchus milii TaxID=7868 RepID=A0A4W3IPX0_CALMI